MRRTGAVFSVGLLVLCSQSALATPAHVSIDLSGLGGASFQLQIALYDNSGVIGDCWALIDNVAVGSAQDNFETGTLGGFNASLNPASVSAVAGSLNGTGSYLLRISEDPVVTPTIAFRNYSSPGSSVLIFDFDLVSSGASGPLGQDELVFSLLNPTTLNPLEPGLTGAGDLLAVSAGSLRSANTVGVTAIPVPGALLLGLLGSASVAVWRKRASLI